jgi:hypothetical protein
MADSLAAFCFIGNFIRQRKFASFTRCSPAGLIGTVGRRWERYKMLYKAENMMLLRGKIHLFGRDTLVNMVVAAGLRVVMHVAKAA